MHIDRAVKIAQEDLRACYGDSGIFAGKNHFKDYWARDSFFSTLGSIKLKDFDIIKKNFNLFLRFQNKDGEFPLRIGKSTIGLVLSYYGINRDGKRNPLYTNDKSISKPVDQNSLFIIALCEYCRATKDSSFFIQNISSIERAIGWNFLNDIDNDLLLEENMYCNWADSVKKRGKVLYSNVCHCHALISLSELFHICKNTQKRKHYLNLHDKVKKKINELFWNGEHYIDWIDNGKHYNYFASDGNFLAVLWDIADKEKSRKIEEYSHLFDMNDVPSACVHPNYPDSLISFEIRLIGLSDYHNGLSWLWLGCINALAKHKLKMHKEAKDMLEKISTLIINHGRVYEVYEKTGKPVQRILYKAENPFAWSSGLFIYAVNEIIKNR